MAIFTTNDPKMNAAELKKLLESLSNPMGPKIIVEGIENLGGDRYRVTLRVL